MWLAEVFKPAIQRMAPAILVCYNRPSGDPTPSPDDVVVTRAKERGLGFS